MNGSRGLRAMCRASQIGIAVLFSVMRTDTESGGQRPLAKRDRNDQTLQVSCPVTSVVKIKKRTDTESAPTPGLHSFVKAVEYYEPPSAQTARFRTQHIVDLRSNTDRNITKRAEFPPFCRTTNKATQALLGWND